MINKLKVDITDMQTDITIPTGIRLLIRKCGHAVLQSEGLKGSYEISVNLMDNDQIQALNKEYRHIDKPTDVLSFPTRTNDEDAFDINPETGAQMLGDIAISVPKVYAQAEHLGHTIQREFGFLAVHGMLHLLGYDHEEDGLQALKMREKEEHILAQLGLQRDLSLLGYNEEIG